MGFGAYWNERVAKTTAMGDLDQKLTITVESLQKELGKAYAAGFKEASSTHPKESFKGFATPPFNDFFDLKTEGS